VPNTLNVNIAWGDCDEAGLVFYPNYFYWMDSAFHALLKSRGINHRTLRDEFGAHGVFIIEIRAQFISSATYDQPLSVEAQVARWGTRSFEISYVGTREGEPIFKSTETRVWIVKGANGKVGAAAIPAAFKDRMGG
jgi:4-hydroxybenzoyl-CoA thioesterase